MTDRRMTDMRKKKIGIGAPWQIIARKRGDVDYESIVDANGNEILFNIYSCNKMSKKTARQTAELICEAVNSQFGPRKPKPEKPKQTYGIKAYGTWTLFDTKKKYENYLLEWIAGTEGAEQDRAALALGNLHSGIPLTDTDASPKSELPGPGRAEVRNEKA